MNQVMESKLKINFGTPKYEHPEIDRIRLNWMNINLDLICHSLGILTLKYKVDSKSV